MRELPNYTVLRSPPYAPDTPKTVFVEADECISFSYIAEIVKKEFPDRDVSLTPHSDPWSHRFTIWITPV